MNLRKLIATMFAVAGAVALAVGAYGMQTLGVCSVDGTCPVPMAVTIPAFAGGMLVTIVATIAGAGAVGFGLAFLAPGLGSVYAIVDGHGSVLSFVFGTVFTLVGVLALGGGVLAARGQRAARQVQETGADGVATVLSVRDTGMSVNDNPGVRLHLRIQPADGSTAFDAEVSRVVSRVAIPRPGDRYRAKYDPQDRSRVVLGDLLPDAGSVPPTAPTAMPGPPATGRAPAPAWGTAEPAGPAHPDTVVDQLTKLDALRRSGALTEAEFRQQKARLLEG